MKYKSDKSITKKKSTIYMLIFDRKTAHSFSILKPYSTANYKISVL